jgi:hypothetical protein
LDRRDQVSDTSTQGEDHNTRQLRDKATRAEGAEARLQAASRRVAILASGLDTESPIGELFVRGYDGEYTPEALREEAAKYGVPLKGQATPAPGEDVEGVEGEDEGPPDFTGPTGTAQRRALADNAPADTGEDKDPRQVSLDAFNQALAQDLPHEDAAAASLHVLVEAANRGDKRVVYDSKDAQRAEAIRQIMG